ncbi:carbohydrate ABC transporter permease [Paenibacillus cremeus]|uniref:Sugar ABC transporter permease n=1 Tax=Paenibacillus cremeus TaxID=2163881 RepID=A0A559K322_9BACL|nr:sugar ABC transporter permease [Paenibacillus cremeus]TVY06541.1 sugar ABC transporter permease [Paenibacillus cremeus]
MRKSYSYQTPWPGYWFIFPALLTMLALIAYPLVFGMYISGYDTNLINKWKFVGLQYYIQAVTDPDFLHKLGLTFKFAFLVVAGNMVIGTLLGVLLNMDIRFRLLFRAVLILPWLFPEVVVALLWKWMYNPLYGLINYILQSMHLTQDAIPWLDNPGFAMWGVVIACIWKGYPLVMILILAGLQSISKDLYEAAEIDGGNQWQLFKNITLPGLMPVLLVTLILETVWWFKHFTIVWLLTAGGPIDATSVISIDIYKIAFENFRFGRAAATAVIVFIICFLISYLYRRFLADDDK